MQRYPVHPSGVFRIMTDTDSNLLKCPYCGVSNEIQDANRLRLRCDVCGRSVQIRNWNDVISDPEPSIIFDPIDKQPKSASANQAPLRTSLRHLFLNQGVYRSQMTKLILITTLSSAVAGGIYTDWILISDVLLSGMVGLLLAIFTLLLPEFLVAFGSGTITLAFCTQFFGLYGDRIRVMVLFFSIGFFGSIVLQIARKFFLSQVPFQRPISSQQSLMTGKEPQD
ncbi:MAG: hypothetical protein RJA81_18 [Planctomycetota bacterium]|jgi:hypothetical protein